MSAASLIAVVSVILIATAAVAGWIMWRTAHSGMRERSMRELLDSLDEVEQLARRARQRVLEVHAASSGVPDIRAQRAALDHHSETLYQQVLALALHDRRWLSTQVADATIDELRERCEKQQQSAVQLRQYLAQLEMALEGVLGERQGNVG